ncbi:PQQ-binding-like beta-propeller repeat protein [Streptomyces sp. B6B3]|uniref:outer membrane protein assembly factor BamB family protein n=1 Tax=Streptomyces sp. B6B3 TaxID=3153570 RepID=UPI00325D669C
MITNGGVWGYDGESGEELWRLEHPEGGDLAPCAASEGVNGAGVGALLYQTEDGPGDLPNCTVLAAVDTRRGEVTWSEDLTRTDDVAVGYNIEVPVTVGERAITVDLGGAHDLERFAVADGEELPEPQLPDGDCDWAWATWDIAVEHLVARARCRGESGSQLAVFDAETGEQLWKRSAADSTLVDSLFVTDDPLTLSSSTRLTVYDDNGEVRSEIPLDAIDADVEIGSDEWRTAFETVAYHVTDSLVITRSSNDTPTEDILRGFDAATGEELWERDLPEERALVGAVDEVPLVFYEAAENGAIYHHVARLNPEDGALVEEGLLPRDAEPSFMNTDQLTWDERTMYVFRLSPQGTKVGLSALRR